MEAHMGLEGKVAIVTGGSRGIGFAVARRFYLRGARVVLVARSSDDLRRAVKTMITEMREQLGRSPEGSPEPSSPAGSGQRAPGPVPVAAPLDVTDERAVRGLFSRAVREYGRVDLLVNGAGTLTRGEVIDLELSDWRQSLEVNLTGVFLCAREAVRVMLAQQPGDDGLRGHIVQIVSGAGVHGWPGHAAYAAAKHGVMGLSDTLREEVRGRGIKVSDVLPGMVATAMTDLRDFAERPKLEPDDVARAVLAVADTSARTMITRIDVRHRLPK
ncbi:MAG: 3-oxoacyl-[acyl-carrier-protein] reductase [Thermoleophilia bacterium]